MCIRDRVKANKGSSGVDGIGIEDIEEMGIEKYLSEISEWHVSTDYFQIVSDVRHGVMGVLRFFLI